MYLEAKARPYPLGDLPLIVLAGGKAEGPPPGSSATEWQRLVEEKRREKAEQAHLSRNSRFILDPRSGHHIQLDDPELVVDAIRQVVDAARDHTPLTATRDAALLRPNLFVETEKRAEVALWAGQCSHLGYPREQTLRRRSRR